MVATTASRPQPRSSQSYSHTPHSSKTSSSSKSSSKPSSRPTTTTTPLSPLMRVPASVGQPLPPSLLKTPTIHTDIRSASPNYFGLAFDSTEPRGSAAGPKANWSPQTSSIVSFGPTSPKHLPLDANPEFEAFRRQSQSNSGFNLSHGSLSHFASTPGVSSSSRPRPDHRSRRSETKEHASSPSSRRQAREGTPDTMNLDGGRDSAYVSSSESKRPSDASATVPSFFDIPRQQSPANISAQSVLRKGASKLDERHPRLSLPPKRVDSPSPDHGIPPGQQPYRADTLPSELEVGPCMLSPAQLKDMLDRLPSEILLLDLRVFPQFSYSRIPGALNLCIPTTLLKRPSFNLQKLQDTFTNPAEKERFARWRNVAHIVVYDAHSSEKKDAVSAVNTLMKFSNEGWTGTSYILRGGFAEYSMRYADSIDRRSTQNKHSKVSLSLGTGMPGVAPVAGGCVMPTTENAANPFFSNIRQNQDLIGGVGQMDLKMPASLDEETQKLLPRWLQKAAAKEDHGKRVADQFLHLELDEQSRMKKALSSGAKYNSPAPGSKDVQIAGIEKGGKNRYNNIWPFEHARVRLQGRPEGACDYVNASHIKSAWSNKQYIASQGPLPATFEDFWSVIWDHDVRVIVMLTAESEGGQLKCHPYWSSNEYGALKLKTLSERKVSLDPKRLRPLQQEQRFELVRRRTTNSLEADPSPPVAEQPHAIIRKFTLSHSEHPFSPIREITQIHYSSWPDFGAPASPSQLLALVELSNLVQRAASSSTQPLKSGEPEPDEHSRPMLVHCSAGCGRTGTFCTIDSVVDMLKRQREEHRSGVTPMEIGEPDADGDYLGKGKGKHKVSDEWVFNQDIDLIQKAVEDFRGQRLSMVQSLRQYVLCYETVLEWIAQQTKQGGRESGGGAARGRSGSDPHRT